METLTRSPIPVIEKDTERLESRAKVSGKTAYIHNIRLPGMLHVKLHRSTVAHGRIVNIDVSRAVAVPGVERVLTSKDIEAMGLQMYYGPAFHDQPILAHKKVHHIGEPVAAVIAVTPEIAAQAADLIEVEYEELPAVFHELEAFKPDSPKVHDEIRPATTFPDLKHLSGRKDTNVLMDYHLRLGDVEAGFQQADHIFENTFQLHATTHLPLEPIVSAAEIDEGGRMVVYSATQSPSFVRLEVARVLGWPEGRVRVRSGHLGGGFGAKLYIKLECLIAACALAVSRPVKLSLTMEEQFVTITRHPCTIRLKTGVSNDGRLLARECELHWNTGAFADIGPRITQKSGFTSGGPYHVESLKVDSYSIYTNLPPCGALRGFGIPQPVWAYESQMDIIAEKLGFDPLEFRRMNILRSDDIHATGTPMRPAAMSDVVDYLDEHLWQLPPDPTPLKPTERRGRGVALGLKACVTPTSSVASAQMSGDGSVTLYFSTVDMGQASDTAMALIAGEVLKMPAEKFSVMRPDTDITPYDMGTLGSRSTFTDGNAVRLAALDVRAQVLNLASRHLHVSVGDLDTENGCVVVQSTGERVPFGEIMKKEFGMQAGTLIGQGAYTTDYIKPDPVTGRSPKITDFWMPGGVGVEVIVDTETGQLRITRLVTVADCGSPLNPPVVRQQIYGATMMALGMTVSEQMLFDNGQVTNASLATYKVPSFLDVPDVVDVGIVTEPHDRGPFGAKGVGETGTFTVSPAIANAIYAAVGVRLTNLPLTPERIWEAIHAAQSNQGER